MPRYFFHYQDGADHLDDDGLELPGPDTARAEAVVFMGETLKDLEAEFWGNRAWRLWVTDEVGSTVCELNVSGR